MKRFMAMLLFIAILCGSLVNATRVQVNAAYTTKVTHISANPGENCDTEIGITWNATPDCTECYILYKPASESGWDDATRVDAEYNDTDWQYFVGNNYANASNETFSEAHKFLNYSVDLKELTPNTKYKYRVYDGLGSYTPARYFQTSGKDEYNIVWISDFHTYTPIGGRLSAANSAVSYAASQAEGGVDAIFSTGDTVAYGGSYYFWKQLYDTTWIKNFLYIDLNGNHDNMNNTDSNNTFNYFRIMHNNPENCYLNGSDTPFEPGVVYYFMYNDILWFVFDTETMSSNRAQIQKWAGDVIKSLEGQYKYLFISQHYQWFYGDTGNDSHYGYWKDFCDEYGVDIAFGANNHVYARTHRLYKGEVVPADSDVGTYYIQAPSSDCERGSTSTFLETPSSNGDIIAARYKNFSNPARTHGVSLINVTKKGIHIEMFASENANQTSPSFSLKDEVTVTPKRVLEGEPEPEDTELGDVNGDGKVTSLDAALVLRYDAALIELNDEQLKVADVSGDGRISSLDASIILQFDAGLIKEF